MKKKKGSLTFMALALTASMLAGCGSSPAGGQTSPYAASSRTRRFPSTSLRAASPARRCVSRDMACRCFAGTTSAATCSCMSRSSSRRSSRARPRRSPRSSARKSATTFPGNAPRSSSSVRTGFALRKSFCVGNKLTAPFVVKVRILSRMLTH